MANKRVSPTNDPLVQVIVRVPKSQKAFLDTLDGSASDFIRKLISTQMGGHEAEIAELKEELKEHETQANIIRAQIAELEAEANKQQDDIAKREQLFNEAVDLFVRQLSLHGGYVSGIEEGIRKRVKVVNDWIAINSPGTAPLTTEELRQAVLDKAQAQGVRLYD